MNFKRYHVSKNLFDANNADYSNFYVATGDVIGSSPDVRSIVIPCEPNTTYTLSKMLSNRFSISTLNAYPAFGMSFTGNRVTDHSATTLTIATGSNDVYLLVMIEYAPTEQDPTQEEIATTIMLNVGLTPLPYEPYGDTWIDSHYIRGTSTDTITPPTTIYGDGTAATIGLKGNTVQNGTPSPSAPVDVMGCGDLETSGEHAGQYKIPILNGSTTTNVYLGEVETTRNVKKLVLTGQESYTETTSWKKENTSVYYTSALNMYSSYTAVLIASTHFEAVGRNILQNADNNCICIGGNAAIFRISTSIAADNTAFKAWVSQQYSNGTPVIVWYVLATPETGIVNEPLQKIGSYADSLTTSIATTDGANSLSVDTTVQPSEVSANYHGWHPIQSAHERDNGAWT